MMFGQLNRSQILLIVIAMFLINKGFNPNWQIILQKVFALQFVQEIQ